MAICLITIRHRMREIRAENYHLRGAVNRNFLVAYHHSTLATANKKQFYFGVLMPHAINGRAYIFSYQKRAFGMERKTT